MKEKLTPTGSGIYAKRQVLRELGTIETLYCGGPVESSSYIKLRLVPPKNETLSRFRHANVDQSEYESEL